MFGEHSSVNGQVNPFTVEAISRTVTLFKISRQSIIEMEEQGIQIVAPLRSQIVMKSNWVRFKAYRLREADVDQTFTKFGSSGRRIVNINRDSHSHSEPSSARVIPVI